jgi:hypothetical protein
MSNGEEVGPVDHWPTMFVSESDCVAGVEGSVGWSRQHPLLALTEGAPLSEDAPLGELISILHL